MFSAQVSSGLILIPNRWLDIEVAPDNVVSTTETQLDRLTLVKPDANGKIKYRVKGYYTEN